MPMVSCKSTNLNSNVLDVLKHKKPLRIMIVSRIDITTNGDMELQPRKDNRFQSIYQVRMMHPIRRKQVFWAIAVGLMLEFQHTLLLKIEGKKPLARFLILTISNREAPNFFNTGSYYSHGRDSAQEITY
jgi:hypothetical protein